MTDQDFIYNDNGELVEFIEKMGDKLICHYKLNGNILTKEFLQIEDGKEYYSKAKILFDATKIKLEHSTVLGESRVIAVSEKNGVLEMPDILKEFRVENDVPSVYSVKKDIINKLLDNIE